nr:hypothetical protein [Tanacetum cinerariifolium]
MTLFNGIYDNCIYGAGKPIICTACGGIFPFVYEQEPSYNQNYDDNYYPHESPSFPCYDYCGGSHETFQCQPDNQNIEFSEYDQSTSTDHPNFLNDNEDHPVQNKESPENSSEETVVLKTNQEPPQDSDIHQLIEECSIKVPKEQKQKMEDTMFELVKIYQEKEFLCIHDDEQEVKYVVEQPAKCGNRSIQSLQNFKVVHKSSISFKSTSQISSIHSVAPIQLTKEPEHLLSMGYQHQSITPETESDEVTKSNAENLLPILSKCDVTIEDEIECDMPAKDDCSPVFTTFSKPFFKDNDDLDSSDDESLPDEDVPAEEFKIYSNPLCDEDKINSNKLDPHYFNVESDFVESLPNRDTFIDFSSKFDFSVQDGNSQQEEIDIVTETDDVLPPSVENDDDYDPLLGEADLFLSDNSIPPGIENIADNPEGDICFLEELIIDDSILSHESFDPNFEENPLNPRPLPKPPDVETYAREEIPVVMNDKDEDVDYSSSIFVIYPKMFPLLLSAESEDTIFDPRISD